MVTKPAKDHATRGSNYAENLILPRQQHEDDFAFIIRIQKMFNINILLYIPCGITAIKNINVYN